MPHRSPRAAARRHVTQQLNAARDRIKTLRAWWTAETTIYVEPADRAPGDNAYLRDRLPGEYPEAQRRYWASTVTEIDTIIIALTGLREYCAEQYHNTPEENTP